jgi:hypothetical protein
MILSDLNRYLEEHRQATLADLAVHFGAEPEAVRGMLSIWIAKGRVERVPVPPGCGTSCTLCDPGGAEIYRWVPPGGRDQPAGNR